MPFLQTLGGGSVSGFRITNNEYEPDVSLLEELNTFGLILMDINIKHMFVDNGNLTFTKPRALSLLH